MGRGEERRTRDGVISVHQLVGLLYEGAPPAAGALRHNLVGPVQEREDLHQHVVAEDVVYADNLLIRHARHLGNSPSRKSHRARHQELSHTELELFPLWDLLLIRFFQVYDAHSLPKIALWQKAKNSTPYTINRPPPRLDSLFKYLSATSFCQRIVQVLGCLFSSETV